MERFGEVGVGLGRRLSLARGQGTGSSLLFDQGQGHEEYTTFEGARGNLTFVLPDFTNIYVF